METATSMGKGLCGQKTTHVITNGELGKKLKDRINIVSY